MRFPELAQGTIAVLILPLVASAEIASVTVLRCRIEPHGIYSLTPSTCTASRSPIETAQTFDVEPSAAIACPEANPATEPVGVSNGPVNEADLG